MRRTPRNTRSGEDRGIAGASCSRASGPINWSWCRGMRSKFGPDARVSGVPSSARDFTGSLFAFEAVSGPPLERGASRSQKTSGRDAMGIFKRASLRIGLYFLAGPTTCSPSPSSNKRPLPPAAWCMSEPLPIRPRLRPSPAQDQRACLRQTETAIRPGCDRQGSEGYLPEPETVLTHASGNSP